MPTSIVTVTVSITESSTGDVNTASLPPLTLDKVKRQGFAFTGIPSQVVDFDGGSSNVVSAAISLSEREKRHARVKARAPQDLTEVILTASRTVTFFGSEPTSTSTSTSSTSTSSSSILTTKSSSSTSAKPTTLVTSVLTVPV
jgi:hypothetical protein